MPKCERCGKKYNYDEEVEEFDYYRSFSYDNFNIKVCAECAKEIIDAEEDGVYFETCECCGKEFDVFEEEYEFSSRTNGDSLLDMEEILCCECAMDKLEEDREYDEDEDDENEEE